MHEILPGIQHWTAFRDTIGMRVSSYYVEPAGILIDPMIPEEGIEVLEGLPVRPQQVVLSNRHHRRHSVEIAEALDVPIRVPALGIHDWGDVARARRYEFGDEVAPGVTALEIGRLAPDEAGLLIAHGAGALSIGDTLTRFGGALGFFDDGLLGHDPQAVKDALRERFRTLLERDFDALLVAHGDPRAKGAKSELREFVERPVGKPGYGNLL